MKPVVLLENETIFEKLPRLKHHDNYLAMYSSWYGGIIRDPRLMLIPVDDHIVHRGDGIFEAFKSINRNIYLLQAHLDRLERSAAKIQLTLPCSINELKEIILTTARVADFPDCLFRLFISRGPGSFSPNPYDTVGAQIYFIVTKFKPVAEEKYMNGVSMGRSQIPIKKPWFAQIKSCNYLHNALMKKEAVDNQLDFTVSLDAEGFLGESATENIAIVSEGNALLFPSFEKTLQGTTLSRLKILAQQLIDKGLLTKIQETDISLEQLHRAKEIMMVGTTLDALPVCLFEGKPVGAGVVGPVAKACRQLLQEDMQKASEVMTKY